MGWESSGVVGFDLGPLLQGQMRIAKLKSAYSLLSILEAWDGKPTYAYNSLIIGHRGLGW